MSEREQRLEDALRRIYDALSESPSQGFAICDTVDGIHNPCWCREARAALDTPKGEESDDWVWQGDERHPDWQDYMASNLLAALRQVPDTGDWHAALRSWCERHISGDIPPMKPLNFRSSDPSRSDEHTQREPAEDATGGTAGPGPAPD